MQEKYNVTGMTCAACQARVQKSVSSLTGVLECNVNLLKNSMVVTYDDKNVNSGQIIAAMRRRVIWSFVFTIPLFYLPYRRFPSSKQQ